MKRSVSLLLIIIIGYQLFFKDSTSLQQEVSLQDASLYSGKLIVINHDTQIQHSPNLTEVPVDLAQNIYVQPDFWLDEAIINPLQRMFQAANEDGIHHFQLNSAYRSEKLQQQLYAEFGSDFALPAGYSEHQSGLSVDIGSTKGSMDKTPEGQWLAKHAPEYGFILRYPENKIDVTGISFEPWHFRYVGLPHSIVMKKQNLALEEYIDYLKEKKQYTKKIDGISYFVQYIEHKKSDKTKIPKSTTYEISGDNRDGYIITSIVDAE